MTGRLFGLVAFMLAAGLTGAWLAGSSGMEAGLLIGAVAWQVIDSVRAERVLRWLRDVDAANAPRLMGQWGQIVDRARKQLRSREQQANDAARRLQEFLAAIQASPNGVILLDRRDRIEWCNQTAAVHLGIDPQRDLQQHIGNLVRDPGFTAYLAAREHTADVVLLAPGASAMLPRRVSVHLHAYGEGRRLLLSRDITQVEQAEAMRRDFVANVSHEIRTPLTVLSGFIETLQSLRLEESERTRYLQLMAQQSHRMQTLVNDLLTLSRLEGSPLPGASEATDVTALLSQCEQEARALSHGQHRIVFSQDEGCEIIGSGAELQSAMSNLVSNAVRYTPAQGQITVRWRMLPDGHGEFSVQDTGPGIAAEHIPRLTERFYRVDRSRSRETGGTGLGLAIVKHVAQRHGAQLRVQSEPGRGSTFMLEFPPARVRPAGAAIRPRVWLPGAAPAERSDEASEQR